jgi:hypothetical protein
MYDVDKQLFVGIKITTQLQNELDDCTPGTEGYFKENKPEFLQIVTLGEEKLIGKFLKEGFLVSDIDNVSRNIRSIVKLIRRDRPVPEDSVRIFADCKVRNDMPGKY